ncbi:MAG: hypothetical protein HS115_00790 [Spirochaetales bacterium]|nr:hypothetical protein [Spirochaetales bacterium]
MMLKGQWIGRVLALLFALLLNQCVAWPASLLLGLAGGAEKKGGVSPLVALLLGGSSGSGGTGGSGTTSPANPGEATISGAPSGTSNVGKAGNENLSVTVGGTDVVSYKFKVGPAATTDCADATGYSADPGVDIGTLITENISGLTDGVIRLCVIGEDGEGNWQELTSATTVTWTKDTVNPTSASGVSGPGYSGSNVSISYTAGADATSTVTNNVKLCTNATCDAGCTAAVSSSGSPAALSGVADGSYYSCVETVDAAGNSAGFAASPGTTIVDTINPTAVANVATSPNSYTSSTTLTVNFDNGSDANINHSQYNIKMCSGSDCSTGCGTVSQGGSGASQSGLSDGAYYACVQSVDLAGNTAAYVASSQVTIDTQTPGVASGISPTAASYTTTDSYSISFTAGSDTNPAASNIKLCTSNDCSTGCMGGTTGNSGTAISGLVEGTAYYSCVQSVDLAGNVSAWTPSTQTITRDSTAPALSITAPSGGAGVAGTSTISFSGGEGNTQVSIDGGTTWTTVSSGFALSSLPDWSSATSNGSPFTLRLRETDAAGNIGTAGPVTYTRDDTLPVASASGQPTGVSNFNAALSITVGGVGPVTHYRHKLGNSSIDCTDSGGYSAETPIATLITNNISGLAEGGVKLCIVGRKTTPDTWQEYTAATEVTWTKDTQDPAAPAGATITGGSHQNITQLEVSFTNGTDTHFSTHNVKACTNAACSLGCVGETTDSASPATVTSLADGSTYYACVQSVDQAGNISAWVASGDTVVVDRTNPTSPSDVSPVASTYSNSTSYSVTFTAGTDANLTDSIARLCTSSDCATGCVTDVAGSSPINVTGLSNGSTYYACVQSVDLAGNTSSFVASAQTIVVDTTAPVFTSLALANDALDGYVNDAETANSSALGGTLTGSGYDTAEYKLVTQATACDGALSYGSMPGSNSADFGADGNYKICVRLADLAGNITYGSSSSFALKKTSAAFTSLSLANDATDGYISNAESSSTSVMGGTLTATGYDTADYKLVTQATNCDGALSYGSMPASNSSDFGSDGNYKICVRLRDDAGNPAVYGNSATIVLKKTPPAFTSLTLANDAADGYINNAESSSSSALGGTLTATGYDSVDYRLVGTATSCDGGLTYGAMPASNSADFGVDGDYKICIRLSDNAGNVTYGASGTITLKKTAPSFTSLALANDATDGYINNAERASTAALGGSLTASGYDTAEYKLVTNVTTCDAVLTYGAMPTSDSVDFGANGSYKICVKLSDNAGNVVYNASASFTLDATLPVISGVAPAAGGTVASTLVSFTLSEVCASGSTTWTQVGGAADSNSPHEQAWSGAELNAGAHNNITLVNNPTLEDGSVYDITFECTDSAGNEAAAVTASGVTYSPGPLQISFAETLDTDGDGKIDTYKISLNKPVSDDSFPGYQLNALGNVTSAWLIAGYANVRLIHGSAVTFATDTVDDSTIYLRFDENSLTCDSSSQVGCDTGSKPDLTTTASPGLEDLAAQVLAQVTTVAVTESDGARPIVVGARSLGATAVDVYFSEAVDTSTADVSGNYSIASGVSVSAASRDGTNQKVVHLTTSAQVGGESYTLTVNTNVTDLANYNVSASSNTASFNGLVKPVVSSMSATNATTIQLVFNETMIASTVECSTLSSCADIFDSIALPILSAVSSAGSGNDSATFLLTVNPMIEGQSYTVTVIEDTAQAEATLELIGDTNNSGTFTGDGRPAATVSTDTATACPANNGSTGVARRVVLQYDQTVTADGGANAANNPSNYAIPSAVNGGCISGACGSGLNQSSASSVTDLGGNKYAVDWSTNFATDDSVYRLNITNVQDAAGNTVATPTYVTFQCGTDNTPPSLISISVVTATAGTTVLMLTFSEAVDSVTANTSTNYKYDTNAYGHNVSTAARQSNQAQVQVTFVPAIANGGHQLLVQNVQDLSGNTILANGVNNAQPFIVNAPQGFVGGPVFEDPFADGTPAGQLVIYDSKLYLGADTNGSKLFEMDLGLTQAQTISIDADGTMGAPVEQFNGYTTDYSGCQTLTYPNCTTGSPTATTSVDQIYSACVGGTSTPAMTGSECTDESGTEYFFIGAANTTGYYRSFWYTTMKSSVSTMFPFTEEWSGDPAGVAAYRSANILLFKDQLFVNYGAELGGGGRGGRVCMKSGGCDNGNSFLGQTSLDQWQRIRRIGANNNNTLRNGAYPGVTGYSGSSPDNQVLNAINVMYEYDNDGSGGNESQLYIANGGFYTGSLGAARTGNSDGGIMRSVLSYSSRSSLILNCPTDSSGCSTYWEDVTPDSLSKWNTYLSTPLPQNSAVTGAGNCATSLIEMDCVLPYNVFIPSLKAIPYMRTAPNGDLYMVRNACSTTSLNRNGVNGAGGQDFRTERQVCPQGYEVPQLWMLPKGTTGSPKGAADWVLVAENGTTGKTNMGTSNNTHFSLLEIVGDYLYIGFDNATGGASVYRVDISGYASGTAPAQGNFSIVNVQGIDASGGGTNVKIFSHVTVEEGGTNWLIITTRDGTGAMRIYRTANDQT